jgi:hypothetical protein
MSISMVTCVHRVMYSCLFVWEWFMRKHTSVCLEKKIGNGVFNNFIACICAHMNTPMHIDSQIPHLHMHSYTYMKQCIHSRIHTLPF